MPASCARFADLIAPFGLEAKSAAEFGLPEPDETGTTFEENAYIKAHAAAARPPACRRCPTIPACASTRSTAQPGVYTANWAETPDGRRDFAHGDAEGRGRCCRKSARSSPSDAHGALRRGASAWPGRTAMPSIFAARSRARWSGRRAASMGFGYDPVFLPDGHDEHLRRDDAPRKSTAGSRARPRRCRTAPAPSRNSPARRLGSA